MSPDDGGSDVEIWKFEDVKIVSRQVLKTESVFSSFLFPKMIILLLDVNVKLKNTNVLNLFYTTYH
jgi:hypothetical protein